MLHMKITWVTRSFLDYRIPVYSEINRLCGNQLTVIYFADVVPQRCKEKLNAVLGGRAIGLTGEIRIGGKKAENQTFANTGGFRIPIMPGLVKQIRNTKPDILLSDGFFQWTYAALLVRAVWKTPHLMCYERTLHTERNVSKTKTILRKIASMFIDGICCNGIETQKYLLQFGYSKEKLFMGNMAADGKGMQLTVAEKSIEQVNRLKEKYQITGKLFLYTGQLIPRKGILEMLIAWSVFSKETGQATLLLVGDGEQRNEAESYILKNNCKNIILVGNVDYNEIAVFYLAADILIIPTLEDNWSLVVPEAMSCGLPIICSKYNGCWPELVKPINGWVFDPLDNKDFSNTLEIAWQSRQQWPQMGEKSKDIVKDYSSEKVAGQIFDACKNILKAD